MIMRSVTISHIIPSDIGKVARRLREAAFTVSFMETVNLSRPLSYRVSSPDPSPEGLSAGDRLELLSKSGKHVMSLTVEEAGKNLLSLSNKNKEGGRSDDYIFQLRIALAEYGEGRTKATATYTVILLNRFLELVTLLSPSGLIYGFLLRRALKKLER